MIRALLTLVLLAGTASAQDIVVPQANDRIATGIGATLRALDRVAGTSIDLNLGNRDSVAVGSLTVTLQECRYPVENPAGEAWAWVEVRDNRSTETLFAGWMVASSPALNALDHRRFDIWVLNCKT
ncbi:MAG: DUF2155 domain-containing protein [Roseinatronobacter sp.]